MILYGVVEDSPFVVAMGSSPFLKGCCLGIELGSVIAAAAIAGVNVLWVLFSKRILIRF
jgi:hypothetical protein